LPDTGVTIRHFFFNPGRKLLWKYCEYVMTIHFVNKIVAGLLTVMLGTPAIMTAGDTDLTAWQNLHQLVIGQEIEVKTSDGRSLQGPFVGFDDQSIGLHRKQQDITIPRTVVSRVRLHPGKSRGYTWIGAVLGAGAGAGVGAGIGEHVANQSGGDFRNLKPAIIGVSAGIGALVGAIIGSVTGGRHTTIYHVR